MSIAITKMNYAKLVVGIDAEVELKNGKTAGESILTTQQRRRLLFQCSRKSAALHRIIRQFTGGPATSPNCLRKNMKMPGKQ